MFRVLSKGRRPLNYLQLRNYSEKDKLTFKERLNRILDPEINRIEEWRNAVPWCCDCLVIGGGVIGSSVAYWLKRTAPKFDVVVLEKDPTYVKASTSLSVGGLRQQFSLEENINMSLFGAEFLRDINTYLGINGEPPIDVSFNPYGYLLLATQEKAHILKENSKLQNSLGARNILLSTERLKLMFPWMNTEGIELGCLGMEKEGWFDPWTLLCAFRRKALQLGVQYVHGEGKKLGVKDPKQLRKRAEGEEMRQRLNMATIETKEGETHTIEFSCAVIAAGASSAQVAKAANIGTGTGELAVALPVEPRKRYVYCFHCPEGPGLNTPLTIDPTGTYFRRDGLGGNYICGRSPAPEEEPPVDDLSVDHDFFEQKVWPVLAQRVKGFENLKVKSAWAGYYEYNTFDRNGIIGAHPCYPNLYIATGFSGHGIQQAPAVGRAVAELIYNSNYRTIDLSRLDFGRLIREEPIFEQNVV